MIDEELTPPLLLRPEAGNGRVDQQLDGVIQPQLLPQT